MSTLPLRGPKAKPFRGNRNVYRFYKTMGAQLRHVRLLAARNQEDIAATLNVSFQQVQKYENGSNRIPIDALLIWCRACGISPAKFIQTLEQEKKA